ncbi:MAG TPA: hypothetical protein VG897_13880 [Terriglobales bacterium]|nr:hypothetical protein [Terriglobales bacterium]
MRGRLLSLFMVAAIFLLQGGDCVSLFFADQQAHDCCRKGHCSPKNPDPCCQVSSKTTVTQDQAKQRTPVAVGLVELVVLPAWTSPAVLVTVDFESPHGPMLAPSPPGDLGNFSLPLRV